MTNTDVLKVKAIGALIEAIDPNDEDDCKQTLKMIRGLLETGGRGSRQAIPAELATANGEAE